MANTDTAQKVTVVVGDVTMDWNIGRRPSSQSTDYSWNTEDLVRTNLQRGGPMLLAELIEKVADRLSLEERHQIHKVSVPQNDAKISPNDEKYHHSYANWALYKYEEKTPSVNRDVFAWRVKNFVGLKRTVAERQLALWEGPIEKIPEADIVVLDDAALVFRDQPPDYWEKSLKNIPEHTWLVVKMARPVAQGKLWEYLRDNCAGRLIAIVTADDLRLSEARISRGLSWERTAQDLALALRDNLYLRDLSRCAYVVVSFETAGVFLLTRQDRRHGGKGKPAEPQATLFYDHETIEGMWAQNYPGGMIGYASSLLASVVHQLMINPARPDIPTGLRNGLAAMRRLLMEGYGKHQKKEPEPELRLNSDLIAKVITHKPGIDDSDEEYEFARAMVKMPARQTLGASKGRKRKTSGEFWTILDDKCSGVPAGHQGDRGSLASDVVISGVKDILKDIPQGKFDKLVTVDRREIESYRSIGALIREYRNRGHQDRPLSIAVFGPPGAGKSFGISAVAKTVMPEQGKKLVFNLSQLNDPKELLGALHQVRDETLTGYVPLVFWDEFDTSLKGDELGWLRYFLAPMQDGNFQEGQITHPIGRAIFIFAGGTSESMAKFDKSKSKAKGVVGRFKAIKGPDFVSRLKGYIDVLGPNPKDKKVTRDPDYIIRRAILLRSLLEQNAPQLFELPESKGKLFIDGGVLRAFLSVSEYEHGARSMESIIGMSLLTGKSSFERSSLPSEEQLGLHVDGREFYDLIEGA